MPVAWMVLSTCRPLRGWSGRKFGATNPLDPRFDINDWRIVSCCVEIEMTRGPTIQFTPSLQEGIVQEPLDDNLITINKEKCIFVANLYLKKIVDCIRGERKSINENPETEMLPWWEFAADIAVVIGVKNWLSMATALTSTETIVTAPVFYNLIDYQRVKSKGT